jgi:uncharacterized protein YukE
MSEEIVVDPGFLSDLASRYRGIASSLRAVTSSPASLHEAPPVEEAYRDFQSRWDWTREKFAEAADGFADAIAATSSAFTEADNKLAATLDVKQ